MREPIKCYHTYILSTEWRDLRIKAAWRAEYLCEICGCNGQHTHHWRYPKGDYGRDCLSNLIFVCIPCHRKIHSCLCYTEYSDFNDRCQAIIGYRRMLGIKKR